MFDQVAFNLMKRAGFLGLLGLMQRAAIVNLIWVRLPARPYLRAPWL